MADVTSSDPSVPVPDSDILVDEIHIRKEEPHQITELGGTETPTLRFVIDPQKGLIGCVFVNCDEPSRKRLFDALTSHISMVVQESSRPVTPKQFARVARETARLAVENKVIFLDTTESLWKLNASGA